MTIADNKQLLEVCSFLNEKDISIFNKTFFGVFDLFDQGPQEDDYILALKKYIRTRMAKVYLTVGSTKFSKRQKINTFLERHIHQGLIVETGFNQGISALNFLHNSNCDVVSFDIMTNEYSKYAKEFFLQQYPDRFTLVEGDTTKTLKPWCLNYKEANNKRVELIFIDGDHSYQGTKNDILGFQKIADENTWLLVDDVNKRMDALPLMEDLIRDSLVVQHKDKTMEDIGVYQYRV